LRSSVFVGRSRARRRASRAWPLARTLSLVAGALAVALTLGLLFAGSPAKLAEGVRIAGVDVGGMTSGEARGLLERRAAQLSKVPVVFTDGTHRFSIRPAQLGVAVDWRAAVASARREGQGFGPFRGLKRLKVRLFPEDLAPPTRVYEGALDYKLSLLAREIDQAPRQAAIQRHGLAFSVLPAQEGRRLDRDAAAEVIVRALASFRRDTRIGLPLRVQAPTVLAAELEPALQEARRAVSAPVRLRLDGFRWLLPRWRIAKLLELPHDGRTSLRLGGPDTEAWLDTLAKRVRQAPRDASFGVDNTNAWVVPSRPGVELDVDASSRAILAAITAVAPRSATLVADEAQPKRTTAEAAAMGITGRVSEYTTIYGGIPNRIHNVQLVAHLVDGALIPPGKEFSFNATTGERNAAKGFLEAPVIINGELQTGLGGGVCQVSTTVFNAAYEAGLPIPQRTNHALYISHYPLGRDATVDYPSLDLRFRNDTDHWLLLRTFVGSYSLTVRLYGSPLNRRIESEASPLIATRPAKVRKIVDPTLEPGQVEVEEEGAPYRKAQVLRRVFSADGKLLHEATFYSSYVGEPRILRVGPKKPKPKPKKPIETPVDVPRPG
jgi:vancomycin resistance protein YoaR